ncbi:MAG: EF-hand domain-containing protein [Sphingomonas sp.]|uniref:EF-hand domain-containing protein n=1 Tax=Sphingomonas sp. TaxID=28214 RepID=UPI0017DB012E|nr:EF-hand domain-containing protein [Sphingomonas sp.]MBA3667792.1 EF-hand domain-containing protein [Sphingomonas sp.]
MARFLAGVASCFLLLTGAFLLWQGRAQSPAPPPAPQPRLASVRAPMTLSVIPDAPLADAKSKEEKRFARADKDEDGKITLAELVEPRRKAFAKLDLNQDGKLGFEEWSVKTIDKYKAADRDANHSLSPAEYAATAPKRKAKPACGC